MKCMRFNFFCKDERFSIGVEEGPGRFIFQYQ